ncbi:hypothetical protein M3Y99_01758200 [Aphelenchoides fujianensis]|nr:hypothetical protein M3Y99_01758200 [Aphelenchoides fujianensis]
MQDQLAELSLEEAAHTGLERLGNYEPEEDFEIEFEPADEELGSEPNVASSGTRSENASFTRPT